MIQFEKVKFYFSEDFYNIETEEICYSRSVFKIATEGDEMKVMAIAPYEGLKELMIRLGNEENFELQVEVGDLQKGVLLANEAINNGVDIIISRGGTAELIQKEVSIPVIEIEVSGYDMLRVLTLVKEYGGKAAIVGFSPVLEGAGTICEILDINISAFKVLKEEEVDSILHNLKKDGYQMIVGDVITVKKAENLGLNGILLTSGKESVLKSFQNAKKMHNLLSNLKNNYLIPYDILQEEREGVIVYNQAFHSVFSNPYFKEKINQAFENKVDIKSAVNEVLNKKDFKSAFYNGNVLWKITGSLIRSLNSNLAVFRMKKCEKNKESSLQGVSIFSTLTETSTFNNTITKNEEMRNALELAELYSDKEAPVWINGEKGTGKERLAHFIHFSSVKRSYPLFVVDCELATEIEWDILLHENQDTNVLLYNEKGTVFLKNINFLMGSIQKRLLTYLQKQPLKSRIITSSSESMESLIEKDIFNRELYYLLAPLTIHLPSLNERKEDMENLVFIFINEFNTKYGKQIVGIRNEAREELENFKWSGNISQLKHAIEKAVLIADGPYLESEDVNKVLPSKQHSLGQENIDLTGTLEEIEKRIIKSVWIEEGMNQTRTAERLGINRTTLWRKLK